MNTLKELIEVDVNKYLAEGFDSSEIAIYLWAKGEEFASTIVTWNQLEPLLDFNLIATNRVDSYLVEC